MAKERGLKGLFGFFNWRNSDDGRVLYHRHQDDDRDEITNATKIAKKVEEDLTSEDPPEWR